MATKEILNKLTDFYKAQLVDCQLDTNKEDIIDFSPDQRDFPFVNMIENENCWILAAHLASADLITNMVATAADVFMIEAYSKRILERLTYLVVDNY